MGKTFDSNDLQTRRASASLLALSLAASLAAFGCTTNLNPGNGTPTRSGSEIRTAPSSGVNSGSESAPVVPPPMTSSYTRAEVMPNVQTQKRSIRRTADEAIAIMTGRAPLRGRYLGPASPASSGRAYASDDVGGFVNPTMLTNPQLTINSSTVAGTTTTAAATVAGTTTTALPAGTFAAVRPTATETVINNSTVTAASAGTPTTLAVTSSDVRLVRDATGVTITNASSPSNQ